MLATRPEDGGESTEEASGRRRGVARSPPSPSPARPGNTGETESSLPMSRSAQHTGGGAAQETGKLARRQDSQSGTGQGIQYRERDRGASQVECRTQGMQGTLLQITQNGLAGHRWRQSMAVVMNYD